METADIWKERKQDRRVYLVSFFIVTDVFVKAERFY